MTAGTVYLPGEKYTYYEPNEAEHRLIKALRSGDFSQGQGFLEYKDLTTDVEKKLCCLGVACRISKVALTTTLSEQADTTTFNDGEDKSHLFLPNKVRLELDWASEEGRLIYRSRLNRVASLSTLNDEGFSFSQIADIIEAGLVEYTE